MIEESMDLWKMTGVVSAMRGRLFFFIGENCFTSNYGIPTYNLRTISYYQDCLITFELNLNVVMLVAMCVME